MEEKTLVKAFTKHNRSHIGLVIPLYRSERGARLLSLTCWSFLVEGRNVPLIELPSLTHGSEEDEASIIQEVEGIGLRYEIFVFVGKVENLRPFGENYFFHLEEPSGTLLANYRGIRSQDFVMVARYGIQSFGVPQEIDLLADIINEDGYVSIAPGETVCVRVNHYNHATQVGSGYAALRKSILGGSGGAYIRLADRDGITFFGDLLEYP